MLISHKYKFITIDIPKTGTRTLRETLRSVGAVDLHGKGENPKDHFYQHGNIIGCKKGFEERGWDFNNYLKFSMVRNPWKRYVSFLLYKIEKAKKYQKTSSEELKSWSSFKKFEGSQCLKHWDAFDRDENRFLKAIINNNPNQESYIKNQKGCVGVDFIGQLESIYKDFAKFCEQVGVIPIPDLKHSNKGVYEKPYEKYYTQELIDMVAEKEKWVIGEFDYNFKE
jgi:hypothetical protein